MEINKRNRFLSYFILFLLIAQAGFPFFVGNQWLLIFTGLTAMVFVFRKPSFNKYFIRFFMLFLCLMILQVVTKGNFLLGPFWGFLLRLIYAYMAIKVIGKDFSELYINLIYYLAIIGLAFWAFLAFVPGVYEIAEKIAVNYIQPLELYQEHGRNNLVIYTNEYWLLDKFPRNAGPFWEPGGYGVFLVIAFLLNFMKSQKFLDWGNIVFIISILITFSLGTYIAFLIFILTYLVFVNRLKRITSFVFASFLLLLFVINYSKYDFLSSKLEARENKVSVTLSDNTTYENLNHRVGRNDQTRLDLKSFFANPIIGEGQFVKYKYGSSASGLTALLRIWGIAGFLLIFGSMFYSFKKYILYNNLPKGFILVSTITFMAVSLTQGIWGKPLFLGFSYIYLVLAEYKYPKIYSIKQDNKNLEYKSSEEFNN